MKILINTQKPLVALNRVITFLALILVASCVVLSWHSWHEEKKDKIKSLSNIIELAEKGIDSYFSDVANDMIFLSHNLIGADGQVELGYAFNLIQRYLKLHPHFVNITFMKSDGQILFTGKTPPGPNLPTLANESSFQLFRDELQQGRPLSIGRPLVAVISKVWIIPLRYGLWDQNGKLQFIVSVNLPVEMLQNFWKNAPFTTSSAMGLMRDDGFLVSRYPVPVQLGMGDIYGKPRTGALIEYLKKEGFPTSGYVEGRSSLNGPGYLSVFYRLEHFPITLFIAMPISDILTAWWEKVWATILLTTILIIGAFLFYRMALKIEYDREAERKITTQALLESEKKYRSLVETTNDCIWETDANGRFTYLSPTFLDITGYLPEAFLGRPPVGLFPKDEATQTDDKQLTELTAQKSFSSLEYTILHREGKRVVVEVSGVPIISSDGLFRGFRGITRDITTRKNTEEALLASKERLSLALMGADMGMWEWNLRTGEIFLNSRMTEMLGYSVDEIEPTMSSWRSLLHPDDMFQNLEALNAHLTGAKPFYESEHRFLSRSGAWIWVLTKGRITQRDKQGRPLCMAGTHLEISDRKRSEEVNKLHLAVMETVVEGIFLVGVDDNIIKWTNGKFEQMFGYEPGEMVGMHVDSVNAPTEKTPTETRISIVDELLQKGEWHGEVENIKKDGTHFWCYSHVSLFDHPQFGKVMVSAHTDIAERKQSMDAMQDSEERFHSIFDNALDGILFTSPDGPIFAANTAACLILGWSEPELCESGRNLIVDLADPRLPAALEERRRTGKFLGELTYKRQDGSTFPVGISSTLFTLQNGEQRTCIVFRDISERRLSEEALKNALHEKEILLREIHHRVKNNMQVVSSLLTLQAESVESDLIKKILFETRQRIYAMALIHETLYSVQNFTSIDLPVYLNSIINYIRDIYAENSKVTITTDIEKIDLNMDQIVPCGLIVNEIITNAFKYAFPDDAHGIIDVTLHSINTKEVELRISDNGAGLNSELDIEKSSSLGLKLVHGLLNYQLHGKFTIDNKAGTTFILRWPLPIAQGEKA